MNKESQSWQEKLGKTAPKSQENQDFSENSQENTENLEENLSETEILQQKLQEEQQKNSTLNDKLLRTLAEIENVRRRSVAEIEKANNFAISNFASDLVVVLENFFLACENMPKEAMEKDEQAKNFVLGVDMTKKELLKILQKNKIERIFPLNEKFDHHFHEAVSQIESDEESGTVIKVIQAGYSISNRLIRPALTVVAK